MRLLYEDFDDFEDLDGFDFADDAAVSRAMREQRREARRLANRKFHARHAIGLDDEYNEDEFDKYSGIEIDQ
jgi:hypothetical protein